MKKIFKIEINAKLDSLSIIRRFLNDSLKYSNLKEEDIYELELCIDEICSNIIKYGYDNQDGKILIKISINEKNVKITIIDNGKPFNIIEYKSPDKEQLLKHQIKGKLGIRTIKTICDKLDYRRLKNKNKIEITKYI